ncbi:MAG: BLUF domain-containing protein [Pseudomonadota bacterium]
MIHVSYVSRTDPPMSSEQLLELLMECRTKNTARGVTGMLLYANGTFLQAIEGDDAVIDELLGKIEHDSRHADIQILSRRAIEQRQYSEWSMGFDRVTDEALGEIDGLRDFGAKDFDFNFLIEHEPVVNSLMEHYRRPHWDPLLGELDAKDKVIEHLQEKLAQVRGGVEVARLALESVTEASRKGATDDALLRLCDTALDALGRR